jgi:hypothetical protein
MNGQLRLALGDAHARIVHSPDVIDLTDLRVRLDRRIDREAGCHNNLAVIGPGKGPHAYELRCTECDKHRGWVSRRTANFLAESIRVFGVPRTNHHFTIRDATMRSCDEYIWPVR